MGVEKTVFISYRRTNIWHARAIFQDLRANGYDAFLDYESLDSGSFERIILDQVRARAHFLVILTPSALERCSEPNDWLRREIEMAIDSQRNVIPITFEDFDWKAADQYLIGKLALLKSYNGLRIPSDFFDEAMTRLRTRFLDKPLEVILYPALPADVSAVQNAIANEVAQPKVEERQLSASEYFERAYQANEREDYDAAVYYYSEALRLNPQDAIAYTNREIAYHHKAWYDRAFTDYLEEIRLKPQHAIGYNKQGLTYADKGDYDRAIKEYDEALRLNPRYADAYQNRGSAYFSKGDYQLAVSDCDRALHLDPNHKYALAVRGAAYRALKEYDSALADLDATMVIDPNDTFAKDQREKTLREMGQ